MAIRVNCGDEPESAALPRSASVVHAVAVGRSEVEDEQGHRHREDPVAEPGQPGQALAGDPVVGGLIGLSAQTPGSSRWPQARTCRLSRSMSQTTRMQASRIDPAYASDAFSGARFGAR